MKLTTLSVCIMICATWSANALAEFAVTNVPILPILPELSDNSDGEYVSDAEPEMAYYVKLLSLKSTSPTELTGIVEVLSKKGYRVCLKSTETWNKVYAGPYSTSASAKASKDVLAKDYADAYIVELDTCDNFTKSPLPVQIVDKESSEVEFDWLLFNAYEGEPIRHALNRFAQANSYDRVVMDIDTMDADNIIAKQDHSFHVAKLSEVDLATLYSNLPTSTTYLHAINDNDQRTLVVSDNHYRPDQTLIVFDVEAGSLLKNINRLSKHYGWKIAANGWQLPVDYQIKYGYPLIVHDLFKGLSKLLKRYPVQAQLMQHTQEVAFVSRPLTAN
jgi:hypothetical protein